MPALAAARNRAKTVSCANNQKQISIADGCVSERQPGPIPYLGTSVANSFQLPLPRPLYLDLMLPYLIGGYLYQQLFRRHHQSLV